MSEEFSGDSGLEVPHVFDADGVDFEAFGQLYFDLLGHNIHGEDVVKFLAEVRRRLGRLTVVRPGAWCGSNDANECSDVTVGRRMWGCIREPPELLLDEVVQATLLSVGKWG